MLRYVTDCVGCKVTPPQKKCFCPLQIANYANHSKYQPMQMLKHLSYVGVWWYFQKKKVSSSCGILMHIGRLGFDNLKLSLMHKATSVLKLKRHFRTKEVCRMGGNTFSSYQNSVQLLVAKGSASAPNPDLLETVTSPQPCWLPCLISIKSPKLYPFQDLHPSFHPLLKWTRNN